MDWEYIKGTAEDFESFGEDVTAIALLKGGAGRIGLSGNIDLIANVWKQYEFIAQRRPSVLSRRNDELLADAMSTQVGGGHYKSMVIQPVEFIHRNGIGYIEGNAIKYLCRWKDKGGVEDLKKARHYIDMLIEMEAKNDSSKD